ncbi:MAG: hypothetical protein BM485_10020 [Desulfobulbaceae bacterium DB1]|nr:MAG: hypothetical protein BM485_10020 [Desulfobulbaceae bacterium DB1]
MAFVGRRSMLLCISVFLFLSATDGNAKEVQLQPGESFREGDLTVTCRDDAAPASGTDAGLIRLKECQYWDDFKKTCLFEKTTFVYKNLRCVEECRHWDSFNNVCLYQTRCVFHPEQGSFVLTDCAEFDDFSNKCLKHNEKLIGGSGRKRR